MVKVTKVDQRFTCQFEWEEKEARALQAQIARARGALRDKLKEPEEKHKELSELLDALVHRIPAPWKPEEGGQ